MYVNQATVCVIESFIIRSTICTFIAAKLSQIALFHIHLFVRVNLKPPLAQWLCTGCCFRDIPRIVCRE